MENREEKMIICVDFDGTCVTHAYPIVGKDIGAVPVLKKLLKAGHEFILYTMRSYMEGISPVTNKLQDGGLNDAVKWFADNEIPLYGINENPTQAVWTASPKPYAQLYIDDSGIGCPIMWDPELSDKPFVDWEEVERILITTGVLPIDEEDLSMLIDM
jgi:hypothetical protein